MSRKRLETPVKMMTYHSDPVNPSHYKQGSVECIDALAAATHDLQGLDAVCTANAIKYLWRWKQKNGVEDLKKAQWYIDRLITDNAKP
jgi:hypothetical protein